jgi:hypothetical protein
MGYYCICIIEDFNSCMFPSSLSRFFDETRVEDDIPLLYYGLRDCMPKAMPEKPIPCED